MSTPASSTPHALFDAEFQRRLELLALIARRITRERERAERRSRHSGSGSEFADYRDYSPGDDYRHVDWKAYARVGKLLLRLYEQPADVHVHLLIDRSASMGFGAPQKLAYAKKLAAALAYVGLSQLDRVSLFAFGGRERMQLRAARGKHSIFRVFDFLAQLEPAGHTDLAGALRGFTAEQPRAGLAILISDLYDPQGFEPALDLLRYARFETRLLRVVDRAEREPELHGELELCDAETGRARTLHVTPELLARYRAARAREDRRLHSYCAEKHVALFTLETAIAPEEALLSILRRGGLLG